MVAVIATVQSMVMVVIIGDGGAHTLDTLKSISFTTSTLCVYVISTCTTKNIIRMISLMEMATFTVMLALL